MNSNNLVNIANKIRTPLALAGITVIVLYAIIKQILSLPIFDRLGSENTFIFLNNLLDRFFWLALISTVLGVISYLITFTFKKKSKPKLIDARIEPNNSHNYIQEGGVIKIKNKEIIELETYEYEFPDLDFLFSNKGNTLAILSRCEVLILDCEIVKDPILKFIVLVNNEGDLVIYLRNKGWGIARNCLIELSEPSINKLFPKSLLQFKGEIKSGEEKEIIKLNKNFIDLSVFHSLFEGIPSVNSTIISSMLTTEENDEDLTLVEKTIHGIEIGSFNIQCKFIDEKGRQYQEEKKINVNGKLVITSERFIMEPFASAYLPSDMTYIAMIDPLKKAENLLHLNIKREIPAERADRFHIKMGATMSCNVTVRFKFILDDQNLIESENFQIEIWNPIDSGLNERYKDIREIPKLTPNS